MATKAMAVVPVQLRIIVTHPVRGCAYAVQRGKTELDPAQVGGDTDLEFQVSVELKSDPDGPVDVRGAQVQGPRGGRFVYINSGTLAGQSASCWTRRAKIPLRGLLELFESAEGHHPANGIGLQ